MFLLLFTLPGILVAQEASSDYRDFDAVRQQLESWAREHPERLELENIGSSAGGKGIMVAHVAAKGETEPDKRPAIFVGAALVSILGLVVVSVAALRWRRVSPWRRDS